MATHSSAHAWRIPWTEGAWQAAVHGVTRTQLSTHTHTRPHRQRGSWAACPTCLRPLVPAVRERPELRVAHGRGDIGFDVGLALGCRQVEGSRVLRGPLLTYLGTVTREGVCVLPGPPSGALGDCKRAQASPPEGQLEARRTCVPWGSEGPDQAGGCAAVWGAGGISISVTEGDVGPRAAPRRHLSPCPALARCRPHPGGEPGIALPPPLLAPLPVPSFIAAPVLPPSAPSRPPETQTGYPELLQRSELPPPPADPGEKQEGAGPGPRGGAVPAGGVSGSANESAEVAGGGRGAPVGLGAGNYLGSAGVPGHPEWAET